MHNDTKIIYGLHNSPFGSCFIALTSKGIIKLSFISSQEVKLCIKELQKKYPKATFVHDEKTTKKIVDSIFSDTLKEKYSLVLSGTDFQIKVWNELQKIPLGKIASYAEIAQRIKSPKAVRAVGTACGANPVAFLIPCHRVLTSDGKMGGYRWGIERKKKLLAWEAAVC